MHRRRRHCVSVPSYISLYLIARFLIVLDRSINIQAMRTWRSSESNLTITNYQGRENREMIYTLKYSIMLILVLLHVILLHTHVDCCVSAKECNGPMAVQRLQPTTSNDGISDGFLFILDPKDKCRDCCKHFRPNTCSGTGTQLVSFMQW